jgi:predicted RNA binding protein YcfA (HicA-like mRNA interferase family)
MIASEPTRITLKRLKKAGFTRRDAKGSHSMYTCSHGVVTVLVADGHRETSAALVRKVNQAIERCATTCP